MSATDPASAAGFDAAGFDARLGRLRERLATAPDPAAVRVVAVTKGHGAAAVRAALAAGLTDVGENYAAELLAKVAAVGELEARSATAIWHYLGAVQRNKVGRLAPVVSWWQGVHRLGEGRAIAARRPGSRVLVQVDLAGLPGRGGCPPAEVPELVGRLRQLDLDVEGLMAVGPPGPAEGARPGFASVARTADRLDLPVRSYGMSDDLEVALSEGATMVRIGRALFGPRPGPAGAPSVHPPTEPGTTL